MRVGREEHPVSEPMFVVLALFGGVVFGWLIAYTMQRVIQKRTKSSAQDILLKAEEERERLLRDAKLASKERLLQTQEEAEAHSRQIRSELELKEQRIRERERKGVQKTNSLDKREDDLNLRDDTIHARSKELDVKLHRVDQRLEEIDHEVERVGGMTKNQAREELVRSVEEEARVLAAQKIEHVGEESRRMAEENATRVIAEAIQRLAGGFVGERTITVVDLPGDEMKGRIIGREGRNIRAIEAATGVDIIIDDTPEIIVISGFNPVRREIAKRSIQLLIEDGRIHPARIEEVVTQTSAEMDEVIQEIGEKTTFELGIHGIAPELLKVVGELNFRLVNGQNLRAHCLETAAIAGMMAEELGLNAMLAKRAGLLHDIGHALEHTVEGRHTDIGADFAKRFGESQEVVNAIRKHHDDSHTSLLAILVQAADKLSKNRPGARSDNLKTYIKRLEDVERICSGFQGVETSHAFQAGNEVRVVVSYTDISHEKVALLGHEIAKRLEDELTYPGEIMLTLIREARAVEIAR